MLGLPPAFVLSQDQTLRLNENFFRHWIHALTRSHRHPSDPKTERHDIVSSQRIHEPSEVSFTTPPKWRPQRPRRPRFSFFKTRLSKNRPDCRETGKPPSRSISLSRPQQENRPSRSTPLLVGNHQTPEARQARCPAAGGRVDIFTVDPPVNTARPTIPIFLDGPAMLQTDDRNLGSSSADSMPLTSCSAPSASAPLPADDAPVDRLRRRLPTSRSGQIPAASFNGERDSRRGERRRGYWQLSRDNACSGRSSISATTSPSIPAMSPTGRRIGGASVTAGSRPRF